MSLHDNSLRPTETEVAAVIVNWNCAEDTLKCAKMLASMHPRLKIIVVDNGSSGTDVEQLTSSEAPDQLVLSSENGGYAHGVNLGMDAARTLGCTWAWLTNPDSLPRQDCLNQLLANSDQAVALGTAQNSSASPDIEGRRYITAAQIRHGRVRPYDCPGCSAGLHFVDVVTGASILINLAASAAVGGMDESFFHYKEEFEFVERLGKVGSVAFVCTARVWHRRGGSMPTDSPSAAYYDARNEILYLRRRYRLWPLRALVSPYLIHQAWSCLFTLRSDSAMRTIAQARLIGLWDGLHGVGGRTSRLLGSTP